MMDTKIKYKKCSKCNIVKPIFEFNKHKKAKDGLRSYCKSCTNKYNKNCREKNPEKARGSVKNWREKNPEKVKEDAKNWREVNPEKVREYNRKWHKANSEKVNKYKKKWHKANSEKVKESQKKWKEINPEKVKESSKKYREVNREKVKESKKKYREANPEKVKEYKEANREKIKESIKKWQKANSEKVNENNRKWKEKNKKHISQHRQNRRVIDPLFKLRCDIRSLIGKSLKNQGYTKNSKTFKILEIELNDFYKWLNDKASNGLSLNINNFQLDHVIPVSLAQSKDEILKLSHYSNLQLLSSKENMFKHNTYISKINLDRTLQHHPNPEILQSIIDRSNIEIIE